MTTLKMPMFCEIELKDEKNCAAVRKIQATEREKIILLEGVLAI